MTGQPTQDLAWQAWLRFAEMKDNPCEHCGDGVYQVRATLKNRNPILIHRACGVDTEGILYIGRGNLCSRVGLLMNICAEDPKHHHHFTGNFVDYLRLDRIADREFLEIRWVETDQPKQIEADLVDDYVKKFGDLPPGNLTTGG